MRNRIIGAFVAVWCAICLSYVGVRTAAAALANGTSIARKDAEAAPAATERAEPTEQVEPTEWVEPDPTVQSEPTTQTMPDDSSALPGLMLREEQPEVEAEVADEEEATDVPTLREYLSGFTCGSCHRNCSLDHPRCHNGSRLAEAKAEEYYSMYGQ